MNGTVFSKISWKHDNLTIAKFGENCYPGISVPFDFCPGNFRLNDSNFRNLEILGFPGHFPSILSILLPFWDFRKFWWNGKYQESKIFPLCIHLPPCFPLVVGILCMWSWMRSICCVSSKRALRSQTFLLWKSKSVSLHVFMCTFWYNVPHVRCDMLSFHSTSVTLTSL